MSTKSDPKKPSPTPIGQPARPLILALLIRGWRSSEIDEASKPSSPTAP